MTDREEVHLPGLRAARGAAAPAGRAAAGVLRPGGAQRADAPTRSAQRLASASERPRAGGDPAMANEAYRAVFLRVHPTGKMVLSLTTESDGKEAPVRAARGRRARRPAARRQGRPRGHRPVRRRPRLQHEPVRGHLGGDRQRLRQDPREGAAARRHGARSRTGDAHVGQRRVGRPTPATRRRSRRSRTSPSTRTAPAPCRPESRAASTRRRSTATDRAGLASIATSTSSTTFSAPNSVE